MGVPPLPPTNHPAPRTLPKRPLLTLLTLILLLASLPIPGRAQTAAGAIQVTETRQQINFPDGVRLTLTAQSQAEIVEVKVFFRPAGSRTWGYAYADFQPGPQITAAQSIPGRQSVYLAPGVDIEYYFLIRDNRGNAVQTQPAAIEYLDQRFNWRRIQIGPLELLYHDLSDTRISSAAQEIRQDLQRVADLLQWQPGQTFKGVIYNRYADANAAFPVQSQATTEQGTFAGYAFPDQGVFIGQGLDRRIITHESAHLMLRDALGPGAPDLPAWLDEGFASYVEPNAQIRGSRSLSERTPPLRAMSRVSGTPQTIPLFYYKAASVVAWLIEQHGPADFHRLLTQLQAGNTTDHALLNVYGFNTDGLDARWAGRPTPPAATPMPTPTPSPTLAPTATPPPTPTATPPPTDTPVPPPPSTTPPPAVTPSPAATPAPPATPLPPQANQVIIVTPERILTVAPERPRATPAPAPPPGTPSPFLFADAWLLAGVALLALAAAGFRFIYSRLRQRRQPPEPPTDWPDYNDC